MSLQLSDFIHSIRFKIGAWLFLFLSLSIGVTMFGIWTYQRDRFIDMANQEALRGGSTIVKALRSAMLRNDKSAILDAVNQIGLIYEPPSRISIIDVSGLVAVSNDPDMHDRVFDRFSESSCVGCHQQRDIKSKQRAMLIDTPKGPVLRNVIKIENDPECYQCHGAEQRILGVLLYDADFTRIFDLLKTIAIRMLLTGLISFLVISGVLILIINKYIHQPIQKLSTGFMEVGQGRYDYWVDENSSAEFGFMADSFNVMSRAIGRFIDEIKSKNMETSILYSIVQGISETIEWERLQKIIIDCLHDLFQAEHICIIIINEKKAGCFDIIWRAGNYKRMCHILYCLETTDVKFPAISRNDLIIWQQDQYTSHRFMDNQQKVIIPLQYSKQTLGLLCVQKKTGQQFSRDERMIIPTLANHLSISLANSRLYKMAITDSLTDLYSKGYLLTQLNTLVANYHKQADGSFFVLLLDLDHFKEVNDTYGHQVGDEVLVQVAEIIKKYIRFEDIAFRYGGEEFVVIVPMDNGDPELGVTIAERLRAGIEEHVFVCREALSIKKTTSIGVASFPMHGDTADAIIKAADKALYEAKEKGRNQVRSSGAGS